ncbi:MAG: N-acetyl-gamma-glutamyl-phosphate reductase [Candidatus Peregrinibacteria bacterium]
MKKTLEQAQVAVIGTSGHASSELLKLLALHPRVKISALATGNEQHVGRNIGDVRAELGGIIDCVCERLSPEEIADRCEVAIATTPPDVSLKYVPGILEGRSKCIDLSGAYRLHDPDVFERYYGFEHPDTDNLQHAIYGLPELFRKRIKRALLVANPGCYPTAAALAVAPVLDWEMINSAYPIIVRAISGYSGAGVQYQPRGGIRPYRIGCHQHTPEIAQVYQDYLRHRDQEPYDMNVSFAPRINDDVERGIDADISVLLDRDYDEKMLRETYASFYEDEPLVEVLEKEPEVQNVAGKNGAQLAVWKENQLLHVIAVIDNLRKGAASQAIQNLNLMCDFDEMEGLRD